MARPCGCAGTCNCLIRVCPESTSLSMTGVGSAANPYVICQDLSQLCADLQNADCVLAALTVEDSDTIDLTLQGNGTQGDPWEISGTVILTPDADVPDEGQGAGNLIEFGPTGIFVSCEAVQNCVGSAVASLLDGLEYNDANNALVVPISTDAGNQASYGSDGGIFAAGGAEGGLQADDTETIDHTLAGSGTVGDPFILTSEVIADAARAVTNGPDGVGVCLSTDAGNALTFGADGCLFSPAGGTFVQANNLDEGANRCVDVTVTGTGAAADPYQIAAAPVLAPDADCEVNILECGPLGLIARPQVASVEFTNSPANRPDVVSSGLTLNMIQPVLDTERRPDTSGGRFWTLDPDGCVTINCDGIYDVGGQGASGTALQNGNVTWQNNVRLQQLRVRTLLNGATTLTSQDIQLRPPSNQALAYPNDGPEISDTVQAALVAGDRLCMQVTYRTDIAGQPMAGPVARLRLTYLGAAL